MYKSYKITLENETAGKYEFYMWLESEPSKEDVITMVGSDDYPLETTTVTVVEEELHRK